MKKSLVILLLLVLVPFASQSQKLEKMEEQLGSRSNGNSDENTRIGGNFSGGGGSTGNIFADLFLEIGVILTYHTLFGFNGEPSPHYVEFNDYPYADEVNGNYLPLDWAGKNLRLQLTAHLQSNEDAVYGGFVQAKFSPTRFLTLDVNQLRLFEALEDKTDHLTITNFNAQFNRVRQPKLDLWWGGGLMLLDRELLYGSPSLSGGFTWYFKRPLSLHAETQMGWPNGIFARQNQIRVQYHLDRYAISAGYQGTKVGSVGIPNWSLGTSVYF